MTEVTHPKRTTGINIRDSLDIHKTCASFNGGC